MLQLQDIHKQYGTTPVLHGVSLEVLQGDILCLLGASGCGKTTLLRIVAGLEKAERGRIWLNRADISSMPVHQRGFGLMFQDYALFPHMNVAENVAFGLRMQKLNRYDRAARVREVLELVGLGAFAARSVNELSGGEQQRVALARSLAPQPRLLMLDEPLGSLDAALRERLAVELREIIKNAGVTAIYVTHDQQEAFAIADCIAVMNTGRVEQVSSPESLYLHPESPFVAEFLGLRNILTVEAYESGIAQTPLGQFALEKPADRILLHPARLSLSQTDGVPMIVQQRIFRGVFFHVVVRHETGIELVLHIPNQGATVPEVGSAVGVQVGDVLPL